MAALFLDVADAVQAELSARFADSTFGAAFTAIVPERSYADWNDELSERETLRVDVVPANHLNSGLETRDSVQHDIVVDVGLRKRFATADQETATGRVKLAELDAMVVLLEKIYEHLAVRDLSAVTGNVRWMAATIPVTYSRDILRTHRQYLGIVRLTYRATKDL